MRRTLFRQLITYMMIFFFILCSACYAVIEFYFDDYYYAQKKEVLLGRTSELAAQYNENGISKLEVGIETYYSEYGISVNFLDVRSNQLYGVAMYGMGKHNLAAIMKNENVGKFFISTSTGGMGMGQMTSWLSYLTQTKDGNLLLGRISYESMNAVVHIVQQFLLYFGIAIAATFIIFAFFFARSISRPLRKLNAIAHEMGNFNFSKKYEGGRIDEIGQLGNTLNGLTKKLENTINQLTGELSKEKTLEKMRTQFTAQVSHELQTPLAIIKGYAEALADNIYTRQETTGIYDILLDEAEKISNMVDDLLDLSQMEAGAYVIRKQKFSLYKLLNKMYEHYRTLPSKKPFNIHLHTHYPKDELWFGDPLRIEQAIRNLLMNAIKHVISGGNINITLLKTERQTHITIENEGEQIPPCDFQNIFDNFYQGKAAKKGTGLGLAITRHIIILHDGKITVRNNDNGVVFEVILP